MIEQIFDKYKVPIHIKREPLGSLYFILRKAELGFALTVSELQWLHDKNLKETIELINSETTKIQYKYDFLGEIREELRELANNKYVYSSILALPKIDSARALIFYKVHNHEELLENEFTFVDERYKEQLSFNKLKQKIGVIENVSHCTDSKILFQKLAFGISLTASDLEWLYKNRIYSISNSLFSKISVLLGKYQIHQEQFETPYKLLLCLIVQKLEENVVLEEQEQSFLKKNGFDYALSVAQQAEFVALKNRYQATEILEDDVSSHLFKVLKKISSGMRLPEPDVNYLKKRKLHNTLKISFKPEADLLVQKIQHGQSLSIEDVDWCNRYGYPEIIFLSLKNEFDICNTNHELDCPLFGILLKLQSNQRLTDDEKLWLETENLMRPGSKVFVKHHWLEAINCEDEFKRTKDYWRLVNASAHWRKAADPNKALKLTNNLVAIRAIKESKLKAALFTTRGGTLRDLDKLEEAKQCALEAISIFPKSHNPYTLMGALCYDAGKYEEGDKWFEKAVKHGAKPNDQDAEIRSILKKKNEKDRAAIIAHLLTKDPYRFEWVKNFKPKNNRG